MTASWALLTALLVHCGSRSALETSATGSGGMPVGPPPGVDAGGGSPEAGPPPPPPSDASSPGCGWEGGPDANCGDTQSDSSSCGVCGRTCQGGACVAGVCQPVLLTGDESFPNTVATDGVDVYWANATDPDFGNPANSIIVRSMPVTGCAAPRTLDTIVPGYPTSLHHDGSYLYFYRSIEWTTPGQAFVGSIVRMCDDASCPRVDLSGPIDNYKWEIALDAMRIFYPSSGNGGVSYIPKGGGVPTTVPMYPGFYFSSIADDDAYVYAVIVPNSTIQKNQPQMLLRLDKATLTPMVLMKGFIGYGYIVVDSQSIFLADQGHVYRFAKTGANALVPTPITPDGVLPSYLASDADRVYWLQFTNTSKNLPSSLHWARKDGSGTGSMILPSDATFGPGLAADDTSLYWATTLSGPVPPTPAKGGIMKVVKPL